MDAFAGFEPQVGEIRAVRSFRVRPGRDAVPAVQRSGVGRRNQHGPMSGQSRRSRPRRAGSRVHVWLLRLRVRARRGRVSARASCAGCRRMLGSGHRRLARHPGGKGTHRGDLDVAEGAGVLASGGDRPLPHRGGGVGRRPATRGSSAERALLLRPAAAARASVSPDSHPGRGRGRLVQWSVAAAVAWRYSQRLPVVERRK